ncbi:VOC family protein [Brevundimonas lenta]|uniref:Catechol 2,3-dioxygenase-like lactoylglutathione lyase family enzyme n=1 Tax=Brevundimonas lenta TaxID=424796 RepID=A0A7W6JD66_9CAUL|nr:VOC family protein [Brevundimonas lenta]MBB4082958.1 catechol 2,3-dioxygenase-like lactoylglutathione lyase family enzyme [Brevundimonas lenta]
MELKRGRLIDHVHLRARDLAASKAFYKGVFEALGIPWHEEETHLWADEFWIDAGEPESRIHLAFQAPDEETVQQFHAAALRNGGRDNGAPGERRKYHPGYYAAFAFDPDGNNIEAVYHGPAERSADAVTLTFEMPEG